MDLKVGKCLEMSIFRGQGREMGQNMPKSLLYAMVIGFLAILSYKHGQMLNKSAGRTFIKFFPFFNSSLRENFKNWFFMPGRKIREPSVGQNGSTLNVNSII